MISTAIFNLARRYAQALYDIADAPGARADQENPDAPGGILSRASGSAPGVRQHGSPGRSHELPNCSWNWRARNAARRPPGATTVSRHRPNLLPEIAAAWRALQREAAGLTQGRWSVPARAHAGAERQDLGAALAGILGQQVELDCAVKPDLLGGMVLYYDGRMH